MKTVHNKILNPKDLLSIKEASIWATEHISKTVSESNISYLIQYGKVKKYNQNGTVLVSKNDLIKYYRSYRGKRELNWKKKLGKDLNWGLSFDHLREKDTTKHVHRLHPYKGKFIPQLVEYFLDDHVNDFKKEYFFKRGDIILDPFCGSGTTLVQSNELALNCIGIDVSAFNTLISNVKVEKYNLLSIAQEIRNITRLLNEFSHKTSIPNFEKELLNKLLEFNSKYFPSPEFRYRALRGEINEHSFGNKKAQEFLPIYEDLVQKYEIPLRQPQSDSLLSVILSRTIRSCRATTHSDLATLKEPQLTSYYCVKHKKICKPLYSIRSKWDTYSKDTLKRLLVFEKLRTDTQQICLTGDARTIDLFKELEIQNIKLGKLAKDLRINGIFTSPPYVGLINYHEQHAYAYDLYGFENKADLEIGPLYKGSGREARESYVEGIAATLNNCKKFLVKNYNVFIVANDKFNLYPTIAEKAGMQIINSYKRPVLNRTERDNGVYSEKIFHLREC